MTDLQAEIEAFMLNRQCWQISYFALLMKNEQLVRFQVAFKVLKYVIRYSQKAASKDSL